MMTGTFINTLVLFAVTFILLAALLSAPRIHTAIDQWQAARKRERAHAGKVTCESPGCNKVATMVTPNGYFCNWDWEPNAAVRRSLGGPVQWGHPLRHTKSGVRS
jgi:hypothetical protein